MKVYNLCCNHDHRFEGWFSSEEDYHAQLERGRLACPLCDSRTIDRLPSAPRLNLSGAHAATRNREVEATTHYVQVLREVLARTEDVGERFAEEARRMHYEETPERAIRGVATIAECAELAEEGVNVMPLPFPALKQPLQ